MNSKDGKNSLISMNNVHGGYLNSMVSDIYTRYKLISSADNAHFNIYFETSKQCKTLCETMNYLQDQPFEINGKWLNYILNNKDLFVRNGYLFPEFLTRIQLNDVIPLLRELYMANKDIQNIIKFHDILSILNTRIQKAN